jgi:hypothetical protein
MDWLRARQRSGRQNKLGFHWGEFASEFHFNGFAAEFDWLRFYTGADFFHGELPHAARPLFHSRIRFKGEAALGVIPFKMNPNRFAV